VRRGEIWIAVMPLPIKTRPVLILSRDSMPAGRPEITVASLTSKARNSLVEVALTAREDGVASDCVVNLDSINTILKKQLIRRRCKLSAARMLEVADALRAALDLP
jgi:mRNA-degrading endonuclease toxin of MazEF toxin-antitoxin module